MAFGYLCRARNFISELQSFLFFHIHLSCLVRLYWDRFMDDDGCKDRSGDGCETRGIWVHTRMVYEMNDSDSSAKSLKKH